MLTLLMFIVGILIGAVGIIFITNIGTLKIDESNDSKIKYSFDVEKTSIYNLKNKHFVLFKIRVITDRSHEIQCL